MNILGNAYFFSDDERYAKKAIQLIDTWFINPETIMNPNLNFGQGVPGLSSGRCFGIIEFGGIGNVITTLEILKYKNALTPEMEKQMRNWLKEYVLWLETSPLGKAERDTKNNHGTHYDGQLIEILIYLNEIEKVKQILETAKTKRIALQIEPDGRQPQELARTKSFSYSTMNLRGLIKLAEFGQIYGVDLWNFQTEDGRSIKKAIDFLTPFAFHPEKWEYDQIVKIDDTANSFKKMIAIAAVRFNDKELINQFGTEIEDLEGISPLKNQTSNKSSVKIKTLECIDVDSVPADFPVSFAILTSGDWQFIAYYNKNRNLTMASRKVSENKWNYKILPTKVGWDSHNSITMAFDAEKCIHLTGNMHNDSLIYFKTENPLDILSLKRVFPQVLAEDELSCTYPRFMKGPENRLVYSYRKGGSGNGKTITNSYDYKTKSFIRLTNQPLFDGLGEMSAYASGPGTGADGLFHVVWVWRDTPDCETNHDLSYARSKDLVHWETVDGTKVELPVTPRKTKFTIDPVPAKGGAINGGFSLFFDQDKNPMIAYMKYDGDGYSQLFLAFVNNGKWEYKQVSHWDYRWEFSGPGSIESEIRITGSKITSDGKIRIGYWHIKKGNGELVLDKNSLALLEDRQVKITEKQEYPEELMNPVSTLDGMSVKWMKIQQSKDKPNEYYGLRWETMGKRRFYEPRETTVPPSAMKLYKFSK